MTEFGRLSFATRMLLATGMIGTFGATSAGDPISMPAWTRHDEENTRWERARQASISAIVSAYRNGSRPRHIAKKFEISKQQVINILKEKKVWSG